MENLTQSSPPQTPSAFDNFLNVFINVLNAVQAYDLTTAEKYMYEAKNCYQTILQENISPDEAISAKFLINYADVALRTIHYTFSFTEEWYSKSLEELQEARRICDELNAALPTLSKPFFEAKDLDDLYDRLPFAVLFYNLIVDSTTSISKGLIEKSQGHYVDDVGLYKNAAALLRQMNRYHLGLVTQETMDSFRSMADNCNRTADTYERKADRLQEKRKQIEFLSPTGNKVFIVHGHDVGVLRELKEILRDLGVEPVILADEYDDGQTVIEKFEHHARQCALAFVLITPDDWVEKANTKYFQARPNVLFELGWFCGRYGRDNVRILRRKDTPLPSDLNGIVTIDFTERLEEVYRRIKLDMERMGVLETASAGS